MLPALLAPDPASAADTAAPTVAVSVPAQDDQAFPAQPVTLTGEAYDDIGVVGVTVAIQDRLSKQWLQADGSFGPWSTRQRDASLASAGSTTTAWSFSFDPQRSGQFGVQARALDAAGNLSSQIWRRFTIDGSGGSDTVAPTVEVSVPTQDQAFPALPVELSGTASDNVGVDQVTVAIRDQATNLWLQADGTFGSWTTRLRDAALAEPGADSTAWSFSFEPGRGGLFGVQVLARDAAGNSSPAQWRRFEIAAAPPPPDEAAFATLMVGRAQWVATGSDCQPLAGAVPLDRTARDLHDLGVAATLPPILARTQQSQRLCYGRYVLHASWDDLADLRDTYGWTVVSGGMTHNDMTQMTRDEQYAESCGALDAYSTRGHAKAWSLFAYGNDKSTDLIQDEIVSSCYAYGRKYVRLYGTAPTPETNDRADMGPRWYAYTNSVSGGRCNDAALPCYTRDVLGNTRYWLPERLNRILAPGPAQWSLLQVYRLVEGASQADPRWQWDCTSDDPQQHWTSAAEVYCYNDFLSAVATIPQNVTVTDPATVAQAWGRLP